MPLTLEASESNHGSRTMRVLLGAEKTEISIDGQSLVIETWSSERVRAFLAKENALTAAFVVGKAKVTVQIEPRGMDVAIHQRCRRATCPSRSRKVRAG